MTTVTPLVTLPNMDITFERKEARKKEIMVRLTEDEFNDIKKVAKRYQVSLGAAVRTLALKGILSLKTPSKTKK